MSFEVKEFHFHVDHAKAYGVDEAIFLYNILFWIKTNIKNKRDREDGRIWTYNTYEAFTGIFTFWTYKQMRRIIKSLVDQNVIITKLKSGAERNKGLFIALVDEELFFPKPQENSKEVCPNGQTVCPNGQTPSYIYTDNKPDNIAQKTCANKSVIKTKKLSKKSTAELLQHEDAIYFLEFWKIYPKRKDKKRALVDWIENKRWEHWDDIRANIEQRTKNQKNWVRCTYQDLQFVLNPKNYLEGECWNDDLELSHKKCKCNENKSINRDRGVF